MASGRQWVRKARLAADPGFYVHVAACAEAALEAQPGFLPALELRSLALMNDHRFAEAREVSKAIVEQEPLDAIGLGTLSDASLELGDFDAAAQAAQKLLDTRPGMAAYSRASYLRWLQGDAKGAKALVLQALRAGRDARDPEPAAWTFVQAAQIFWHEADYDGAEAVYAEALKWVPDYPQALVGRARVALARRQPERAVPWLESAWRRQPLPETAWLLGDARTMLGDAARARAAYEQVVRSGRKSDRLTLALFYATKDRDHDEALRLLEEERRGRGGPYVDDAQAWALYRAGRIGEAQQASERALRLGTRDARLLYHGGAIRLAAHDPSGRVLIERALALNPGFDSTGAAEARELLAPGAQQARSAS